MGQRITWLKRTMLHDAGRWICPAALLLLCLLYFWRPLVHRQVSAPLDIYAFNYPWSLQPETAAVRQHGPENVLTDPIDQLLPWYYFARAELHHGRVPLWYPYSLGGEPFLAKSIPATFYPITLVSLVLPLLVALQFMVMVKPLIAGLGMYAYLQTIGLRRVPALFGAVAWSYSSYFILWLNYPQSAVAGWLPWLLLCVEYLLRPGVRWRVAIAALAAVTAIQLLGGHLETSLHILAATGFYVCMRAAIPAIAHRQRSTAMQSALAIARCGAGLALGGLLAAIQLVPSAQLIIGSYQSTFRAHQPAPHLPLADLSSWLVPNLNGTPAYVRFGLFPVPFDFTQTIGYCGVTTGVVACLALLCRRPIVRQIAATLLALLVLAFGIAYGVQPIFALVHLPLLRTADNMRLTFVMSFCLAALAAVGLDALLDRLESLPAPVSRRTRLLRGAVGGGCVLAAGGALALAAGLSKERTINLIRHLGRQAGPVPIALWNQAWVTLALALIIGAVLLLWLMRSGWLAPRSGAVALTVLAAADLFAYGVTFNSGYSAARVVPGAPVLGALQGFGGDGKLATAPEPLHQGFALPWGIRMIGASLENIFFARAEQLGARINHFGPNPDNELEVETNLAPDAPLLAIENVDWLLLRTDEVSPDAAGGRLVLDQQADSDQPSIALAPGGQVEQTFSATARGVASLAVMIAVANPRPAGTLQCELFDGRSGASLGRSDLAAGTAAGGAWQFATFSGVAVQPGQPLRVRISRPATDPPDRQIRLFSTARPMTDGASLRVNGVPTPGALRLRAYTPPQADILKPIWHDQVATVYQVEGARPRAYVADGILTAASGDQALTALDSLHVPGADAVVESRQALSSNGGQATIIHDLAGNVTVRVSLPAPGVLVLNEGYGDGGWQVTVDGKAGTVLRANYLYQGAAVPAGEHIVHFRYHPRAFSVGAALSLLAAVIIVGLLLWPGIERGARRAARAVRREQA